MRTSDGGGRTSYQVLRSDTWTGSRVACPGALAWHRGTVPYHDKHMKRFALYLILFNFNTTKIKVVLAVNHYQK